MRKYFSFIAAALPTLVFACPALAEDCHGLTGKHFGKAVVSETEQISPSFSIASLGTAPGKSLDVPVSFCRVRGNIEPTSDSDIRFEVWLPAPSFWNRRYQAVGNGGFAGNFAYAGMVRALEGGYAVAATDTGHVGASSDSAWAVGHPEKIVDLGWRAMHETAVAAKFVIAAYYGSKPIRSYYAGCSTGGRQGLVLAQRFPEDYDGIVVGAPASNWPRLLALGASIYQVLRADPAAWLSSEKLQLINRASLKACHGTNGLIDDPGSCRFRPEALLCKPGQQANCLNANEVGMTKLMYDGIRDESGATIYPGFTPGLEQSWGLWNLGRFGSDGRDSLSYPFPAGFYGNLVHQDAAWTIDQFNIRTDLPLALDGPVGAAVFAENPDLSKFQARGGKIIQYHGWHDPAIPANASLMYYSSVADRMGGIGQVQSFYRLFMGTGMYHCGGGPGPNVIGGVSGFPPERDPEHDVVAAVQHWVEDGVAPKQIVATRFAENDPAKGVEAQRPWCPWPQAPRYVGGNRSLATSYVCQTAKK